MTKGSEIQGDIKYNVTGNGLEIASVLFFFMMDGCLAVRKHFISLWLMWFPVHWKCFQLLFPPASVSPPNQHMPLCCCHLPHRVIAVPFI